MQKLSPFIRRLYIVPSFALARATSWPHRKADLAVDNKLLACSD